ncbi:MAG: hypothetical protein LBJ35_04885 [Spirochaetaceae bacterium]|jgi:hypothetical protein|nr:hypothetical protein [Spirochaetaceae bacterium]
MKSAFAIIICFVLFTACSTPRLAVLPFINGDAITDDIANDVGETFAWQLANASAAHRFYEIIPITPKIQNDIRHERAYHSAFDTAKELRADFVMLSFVKALGDKWLFYIVIMDVKTKELIAGDYREFKYLSDIPNFFTSMTRKMMTVSQRNITERKKRYRYIPTLAVDILQTPPSEYITLNDAVVLTQLMANEMANNGKFRVFPRTDVFDAAGVFYGGEGHLAEAANAVYGTKTDTVAAVYVDDLPPADYVLTSKISSLETPPEPPFDLLGEILYIKKNRLVIGNQVTFNRVENAPARVSQLAALLSSLTTIPPPPR